MRTSLLAFILTASVWATACKDSSETPDPVPVEKPEVVSSLKVMTYNIHHANPPTNPNVIDVNAIANVIRGEQPDLVALQEVDVNTQRSGAGNQAQQLASKVGMQYYFAKAIDYQGGQYGVAILSKYTLSEATTINLPMQAGSSGEPRVLATAKVTLPDGSQIRFGSTHLDAQSDATNRQLQINKINDIGSKETLPFIIGGDFNATPGSGVINTFDSVFKRTCQVCAPTIPVVNPTRAIDFIAFLHPANKFTTVSHKVLAEQYASDHRAVAAEIGVEK